MRPRSVTAVSATSSKNFEHKKMRKALHTLQPAATDDANLVGGERVLSSSRVVSVKGAIKNEMSGKTKIKTTKKNRKVKNEIRYQKTNKQDKSCQTLCANEIKIKVEDLICDEPSEDYWHVLAERRSLALENTLKENKDLQECITKLEEENCICKDMLNEAQALVEVLQEIIGEDDSNINNSLDDSAL